jgi:hypothetical protein
MPGDEAKRAGCQPDRDLAIGILVVENRAVELERRIGAERQIGAVGHYQPCCAVEAGAHDLVTNDAIADIDLAGRRSRDANDFILDDGGLPDARLRVNGICRQRCRYAERGEIENAVTQIHFITDRLSRHRTGSCVRCCKFITSSAR